MKEKGLLKDFLKKNMYDPALKYQFGGFIEAYEPMAYLDVSLDLP